jgi:pyrophosphatase PpaX
MDRKYKTLLLDWDGCMAKSLDVWMAVYQELYAIAGVQTTPTEILEKSWGNLEKGPGNFGIPNPAVFWKQVVEEVKLRVATVTLYDGVKETIATLKSQHIKLAIVSSSENSLILPALKFHGLDQSIEVVVTPDSVKNPKPHRESIDVALKRLGAEAETAMIVGDTGSDIKCGQNAEIDTTLMVHSLKSPFHNLEKLLALQPTYVISTFPDLLELV